MVARLIELAYRCNLCRRCAQTCPIGVDNGLIAHELRKVFSQEMGIAAKEIHDNGSMLQLKVGSSTGMSAEVVKDNIQFIDEETSERAGVKVETPWDVEGAEVLLIHNAGEILAWPENPGAFALILNAAGISWTLSSELAGYDSINYGLWYDDSQFARVAIKHAEAAKKLKVGKIVLGECGHAHKALSVIADRVLTGPGGDTLLYNLYTTAGRTTVWNDSTNRVGGTGAGMTDAQTLNVHGELLASKNTGAIQAGLYTDTITATIEY